MSGDVLRVVGAGVLFCLQKRREHREEKSSRHER